MPIIHLSDATHRLVIEHAENPFHVTGERQPDGSWAVPFNDDTFNRLSQLRMEGETFDDVIVRMFGLRAGLN